MFGGEIEDSSLGLSDDIDGVSAKSLAKERWIASYVIVLATPKVVRHPPDSVVAGTTTYNRTLFADF